jgi:type 2A phosphatase activator TIP41
MPSGWYALLRFWLRVDGVLMRLRDTRFHCAFDNPAPSVLREICDREEALLPSQVRRTNPSQSGLMGSSCAAGRGRQ